MSGSLQDVVERLRETGSDFTSVEVKSAAGGFPESLAPSLSALANLPGGGTIILGLDEATGFKPVSLADITGLKASLGQKARTYLPPVRLDIGDGEVDGVPIVVAHVHECGTEHKPCRTPDGRVFVRSWDGDYEASELEEQAFLVNRTHPKADRNPISTATVEDLDPELIALWRTGVNSEDPLGLGRFAGDEQLRRAGILTADGHPTLGGLLALGVQPQQFLPSLALQLSTSSPTSCRARNAVVLTGPLPMILDQALEWARSTFKRDLVTGGDGHVRDVYEYPLIAFRELVANALVHRSFDEWAIGYTAEVKLTEDRLVVTSPGGLYGITIDRLGHEKVTTSRNSSLVNIARYARSPGTGARVIERLSTGIATILEECEAAGLPQPTFQDTGVRFNAVLRKPPTRSSRPHLGKTEEAVYAALVVGNRSADDIATEVKTSPANVRKALRALRDLGLVTMEGPGRGTRYRRSSRRS